MFIYSAIFTCELFGDNRQLNTLSIANVSKSKGRETSAQESSTGALSKKACPWNVDEPLATIIAEQAGNEFRVPF